MASKTANVASNIAKRWQPWKAASLSPVGSLAALPFKATYIAINNIAKRWQPWLAALPVSGPFWQPYPSRLQGCHGYPSGGSVGPDISNVGSDNAYTARLEGGYFAGPKVIRITIAAALASVAHGTQNRAAQRRARKLRRRNYCHRRADAPRLSNALHIAAAGLALASVSKWTQNRASGEPVETSDRSEIAGARAEKSNRLDFCHRRADAC
jgi:hypothetical protein